MIGMIALEIKHLELAVPSCGMNTTIRDLGVKINWTSPLCLVRGEHLFETKKSTENVLDLGNYSYHIICFFQAI